MTKYVQDPPFAVQVELSEGCNLYCGFCGLQGIREQRSKNFKFMAEKTLRSLTRQMVEAGWNPRVEFAMHGEPTMHPDYVGMIRAAREEAPDFQLMMTSNGGGLLKGGPLSNVNKLFEAGLNVLALDDYDGVKIVSKVRDEVHARVNTFGEDGGDVRSKLGFDVYEYPHDPRGSPHARVNPKKDRKLVFIEDISRAEKGNHSLMNNHAGAGAPLNDSMQGRRCAKPFRELSVRWDGNVAVCCNDWRGVYKCGNVVKDGLLKVWNGAAMDAARQKLYHGQRDFGPCKGCDAVSYRTGLLPDKFGRETLPLPTPATARTIAAAVAGAPYTAPVLRPWEQPAKPTARK